MHFDKLSSMQRPLRHQSRGWIRCWRTCSAVGGVEAATRRPQTPFAAAIRPSACAPRFCRVQKTWSPAPHWTSAGHRPMLSFVFATDSLKTMLFAAPVPCAIIYRLAYCTIYLRSSEAQQSSLLERAWAVLVLLLHVRPLLRICS